MPQVSPPLAFDFSAEFWIGVGGTVLLLALTEYLRLKFVVKGDAINSKQLEEAFKTFERENRVEREKELFALRTTIQSDIGHASLVTTQQLQNMNSSLQSLQEAKSTKEALAAMEKLFEERFKHVNERFDFLAKEIAALKREKSA